MKRLGIVALLAFVLAGGGCASVDRLEDTRIEAEVKARLVAEKSANLTRVGVLSTEGVVYLSGPVEAWESRAKAAALAGEIRGVRRVVNTLAVRPGP